MLDCVWVLGKGKLGLPVGKNGNPVCYYRRPAEKVASNNLAVGPKLAMLLFEEWLRSRYRLSEGVRYCSLVIVLVVTWEVGALSLHDPSGAHSYGRPYCTTTVHSPGPSCLIAPL